LSLLDLGFGDWIGGNGGQGPGEDWGKAHAEDSRIVRKE
jgi:hypothetical protein